MTGIEMTHVPYKGSAPALKDVVAGHMPLLFSDTAPSLPLIRNGNVRALGVSTAVRLPSAPDIVPLAEAGVPGFDAAGWFMVAVPAGTPKPIVDQAARRRSTVSWDCPRLQQAINRHRHHAGGEPVRRRNLQRVHRLRDGALGQGRAAGRSRRHGVAAQEPHRQSPASLRPASGSIRLAHVNATR